MGEVAVAKALELKAASMQGRVSKELSPEVLARRQGMQEIRRALAAEGLDHVAVRNMLRFMPSPRGARDCRSRLFNVR